MIIRPITGFRNRQGDASVMWKNVYITNDIKRVIEIILLLFLLVAGFLTLALTSYSPADAGPFDTGSGAEVINSAGLIGAWMAQSLVFFLGVLAYLVPPWILLLTVHFYKTLCKREALRWMDFGWRLLGSMAVFLSTCMLASIYFTGTALPATAGGIVGQYFGSYVVSFLGMPGSILVLLGVLIIGVALTLDFSWLTLAEKTGDLIASLPKKTGGLAGRVKERFEKWRDTTGKKEQTATMADQDALMDAISGSLKAPPLVSLPTDATTPPSVKPKKRRKASAPATDEAQSKAKSALVEVVPSLDLLDKNVQKEAKIDNDKALESLAMLLESRLADFGIEAKVTNVYPGPVITRLEVQPAAGVKVAKITSLAKDLARSLAVISVRVVEVIPGKTVVGIEIPNRDREIVKLSETLTSTHYRRAKSCLTLALGKDIAGQVVCVDLTRMPHLLVAGTTGSGKSVGVNAMLLSILFKANPEQVRLILIDPKMLELSVYEGIPHLLTPVITDMKEAANALAWCVYEMDRRYRLMADIGVRHLEGFNEKVTKARAKGEPLVDPLWLSDDPDEEPPLLQPLPLIVVVIDEFADMMMVVGKKTEEMIVRIAQKARAAGIHLILATQRPSVDVITGLIKANIPGRLSFQVSSRVDSRTILDQGGAEQLLGHGDMLFISPGTALPVRVHGAFVSDDEVHRVAEDWRNKSSPDYLDQVLGGQPGEAGRMQVNGDDEEDRLYQDAVACVVESRRASISFVQRKLRVGYNRAARLVDAMEQAGVVSPADSAGNREVLVPDTTRP